MTIEIIPEIGNFIFYGFVVCVSVAGVVAAAVAFSEMLDGVIR